MNNETTYYDFDDVTITNIKIKTKEGIYLLESIEGVASTPVRTLGRIGHGILSLFFGFGIYQCITGYFSNFYVILLGIIFIILFITVLYCFFKGMGDISIYFQGRKICIYHGFSDDVSKLNNAINLALTDYKGNSTPTVLDSFMNNSKFSEPNNLT